MTKFGSEADICIFFLNRFLTLSMTNFCILKYNNFFFLEIFSSCF